MKCGKRNRTRRGVTAHEIARLSEVSRSTVSAVLTGSRKVREGTRRRVLACIREQNYDSGMIAKALVGELSRMVAVLASNVGSPFHMMVFRGIAEVMDARGYHILFHNVRSEDRPDPETLASLHAYRPAGYIVLKGAEGPGGEHARQIAAEGIPLVSHGRIEGVETHSVSFDERLGMKLATDYVIGCGHRRVGHIAGPTFSQGARERKLGFVESLIEHDLAVSESLIVDAGETASAGYAAALELLRVRETRPTAVVCFNDMVAMGVYRAAHELCLDIPGDLSVMGFDGIDLAALLGPPLTSIDIHPGQLGERAAELLVRVIQNETGRTLVTERVRPDIIERASVKRCGAGASVDVRQG